MANKIGYHIQVGSAMTVLYDLLRTNGSKSAGFTLVGTAAQIKDAVNNLSQFSREKLIGREYSLEIDLLDSMKPSADPIGSAKTYLDRLYQAAKSVDLLNIWWQVFNEKMFDYAWMNTFVLACIAYNKTLPTPLKLVYYNYATGCPEDKDWSLLKDSLMAVIRDSRSKIGGHEYGFNGNMLGKEGLEEFRIGRYLNLRKWLKLWGFSEGQLFGKYVINEYGLDDPGYRPAGVSTSNYSNQLIAASEKYYEPDPFVFCASIYDCSYLDPDYQILPQDRSGTDFTVFYAITAHAQAVGESTQPPVVTPPPVTSTLIKNGNFSQGEYAVSGNPNQQHVPVSWTPINTDDHVEFEYDPHHVKPGGVKSARIYEAYTNKEIGIYQDFVGTPGATYRFEADVFAWCTTNPVALSPSNAQSIMYLRANDRFFDSYIQDRFAKLLVDVAAPADGKIRLSIGIKPTYAVARTDMFIADTVKLTKIADPTTVPTPTQGAVISGGNYNLRSSPEVKDGNILAVLPNGKPIRIESEENGWVKIYAYVSKSGVKGG